MGYGDELMAAGEAARLHARTGRPVCIVDRSGEPRWSDLWDGLPFIVRTRTAACEVLQNGSGCRPYIRYPFTSDGHAYTDWRARDHRPALVLSDAERLAVRHRGFVLIESTIKTQANVNKAWPHWQAVVELMPHLQWLQCGPGPSGALHDVEHVRTTSFREACALLSHARAYVGPEGGMHHAAAALGIPAVVVFGGSPSIESTGYPDHINFGCASPCGRWSRCLHCAEVAKAITPDRVAAAVKQIIERNLHE